MRPSTFPTASTVVADASRLIGESRVQSLELTHAPPGVPSTGGDRKPSLQAVAAGLRWNNPAFRQLALRAPAHLRWGDLGVAELLEAVAGNAHLRRLSWRAQLHRRGSLARRASLPRLRLLTCGRDGALRHQATNR